MPAKKGLEIGPFSLFFEVLTGIVSRCDKFRHLARGFCQSEQTPQVANCSAASLAT